MAAKYVLAGLSIAFLGLALTRLPGRGLGHPQVRTWFIVGGMFGAVSGWLFAQG